MNSALLLSFLLGCLVGGLSAAWLIGTEEGHMFVCGSPSVGQILQ